MGTHHLLLRVRIIEDFSGKEGGQLLESILVNFNVAPLVDPSVDSSNPGRANQINLVRKYLHQ